MLEWHTIYDSNYEISNTGLIRNIKEKNILKQAAYCRKNAPDHPYYRCSISNPRKTIHIHKELAKIYIPNPENKKFVDHIDGNTLNNSLENLRWVTPQENAFNSKCYSNNLLKVKGVQKRTSGRYRARIRHNGKLITIGTFLTLEEAKQAYINKSTELFGIYHATRN